MPFPSLSFTFRTAGAWGAGLGADLTPAQADTNVYQAKLGLEYLRDNPPTAVSISSITQSVNTITVHLTDATTQGPFTLPSIPINFRGAWAISTAYAVGDVITSGGATYLVIYAHTSSGVSFDPGANDGLGHNYYGLLLASPAGALPAGGSAGQVLTKTSSTDYATTWAAVGTLRGIKTVSGTTHTLSSSDIGKWHRFTNVSGCTITVPANADVSIAIGATFVLRQADAGGLSLIEGASYVVINGLAGFEHMTGTTGATVELVKVAADEWDLCGYLVQASA